MGLLPRSPPISLESCREVAPISGGTGIEVPISQVAYAPGSEGLQYKRHGVRKAMILLLHSNSAIALKTELHDVLVESLRHDAESLRHMGIVSASFEPAGSLPEIVKSPDVALILLVLTAHLLEHSVEIVAAIRKHVDLPIIVIY